MGIGDTIRASIVATKGLTDKVGFWMLGKP